MLNKIISPKEIYNPILSPWNRIKDDDEEFDVEEFDDEFNDDEDFFEDEDDNFDYFDD